MFLLHDQIYELQGEKNFSFLHGQLSNHIKAMNSGDSTFNFLLNAKGKIQASLFVYRVGAKCFLAVPQVCSEVLIAHLSKMAGLSSVKIIARPNWQIVHVLQGSEALKPDQLFVPEHNFKDLKEVDLPIAIPTNRFRLKGVDCLVEDTAQLASSEFATSAELDNLRIVRGVPLFGMDYSQEHLPQETGLTEALHFDKGCYLGQEIVARLQYRGQIKKQLVHFKIDAVKIQQQQDVLNFEQKLVGKTTSLTFDEPGNCTIGLAWVQTSEVLLHADQLYIQGHAVKIISLPLQSEDEQVRK